MNIKVAAFTVSEKSSNNIRIVEDNCIRFGVLLYGSMRFGTYVFRYFSHPFLCIIKVIENSAENFTSVNSKTILIRVGRSRHRYGVKHPKSEKLLMMPCYFVVFVDTSGERYEHYTKKYNFSILIRI